MFYCQAGWDSAAVFAASIVLSYAAALAVARLRRGRKLALTLGILANVFLLAFFKYHDFYIDNIGWFAPEGGFVRGIFLPLGISFFSFQQIAYLVNVYDGTIERPGLEDYLCYIFFFPKLIMGPIVEPGELISQLNDSGRKAPIADNLASGAKLFSFGLFKKAVLADTLAYMVAWGFGDIEAVSSLDMLIVMLSYTFELYFDFSGYSDMAVGVAKMMNIELPINFDSPYKCCSIGEFWKHWHITLSDFLTKYIYFPLGGSRRGRLRGYFNIMVVFLVSGIWHGSGLQYIFWGLMQGGYQVTGEILQPVRRKIRSILKIREESPVYVLWQRICTFVLITISWVIFRASNLRAGLSMLKRMVIDFTPWVFFDGTLYQFGIEARSFFALIFCIILAAAAEHYQEK